MQDRKKPEQIPDYADLIRNRDFSFIHDLVLERAPLELDDALNTLDAKLNNADNLSKTITDIYKFYDDVTPFLLNTQIKSHQKVKQNEMQIKSGEWLPNSSNITIELQTMKNIASQSRLILKAGIEFRRWAEKNYPDKFTPDDVKRNEDNIDSGMQFLNSVRNVNLYLKKRAQKTSLLCVQFFDTYGGAEYYIRREASNGALILLNEHLSKPFDMDELEGFINKIKLKAKRFVVSKFVNHFADLLNKLADAYSSYRFSCSLHKQIGPSLYVKNKMALYCEIYKQLIAYTSEVHHYYNDVEHNNRFIEAKIRYEFLYQMLDKETREEFPEPQKLLRLESYNLANLRKNRPQQEVVKSSELNNVI